MQILHNKGYIEWEATWTPVRQKPKLEAKIKLFWDTGFFIHWSSSVVYVIYAVVILI